MTTTSRRVFVTGGTGLVGSRLIGKLLTRGDKPVVLSRRLEAARQQFGPSVEVVGGDPMIAGSWMDAIANCDAVIHLAGENVFGKRWNPAFKQLLADSRIKSTANVVQAMLKTPAAPAGGTKVLVNASAIGIYGNTGDQDITEDSLPVTDFMGQLCVDWEAEAQKVTSAGIRCVQVRVGIVLDKNGGALGKLLTPFKLGAGGPVGSGKQYMAWIHHEDLLGLLLLALDNAHCSGPMNGTAPNPVTNKEFGNALGKALSRPSFMPLPGFMLKLLVGEAAAIVLNGQKVLPKKALSLGYRFQFPTIDEALKEILSK
jgi:hypothetical protein